MKRGNRGLHWKQLFKSRKIIFEFIECIGYKVDSMWRFIWIIFFINFHFSLNFMIEFGSNEAIVIFNYFYEWHFCCASRISTPFNRWMDGKNGEIINSWKKYLIELRDYFSKKIHYRDIARINCHIKWSRHI